jgi:CRISPR/Cas system-associated endoribonuclease Cas2
MRSRCYLHEYDEICINSCFKCGVNRIQIGLINQFLKLKHKIHIYPATKRTNLIDFIVHNSCRETREVQVIKLCP